MKNIARAVVAAFWLSVCASAAAGEIEEPGSRVHVLTVETVDESGVPVALSGAHELRIIEPSEGMRILDGGPVEQWNVTIVFDRLLSDSRTIRDAASALSDLADVLVGLGPVEIFVGNEDFTRAMVPTRDSEGLRQALAWIRIREAGEASQLEIRRRFVEDLRIEELARTPYVAVSATAEQRLSELHFGVRQAVQGETRLVEGYRRGLLEWAAENRRGGPSLLILVSGGDDDIFDFYSTLLEDVGVPEASDGVVEPDVDPDREEVGRALSSLGWVTIGFSPGGSGETLAAAARAAREESVETVVQDGQVVDRTIFTPRFDPRDLLRRSGGGTEDEQLPAARLIAPLEALAELADATGGEVAVDQRGLERAVKRLADRFALRVVETSSATVSVRVRLSYAEGFGESLPPPRARRWISNVTPESVAEIRGRRLLDEGIEEGPLLVTAQVQEGDGPDLLLVEVEPVDDAADAVGDETLRLTVGVLADDRSPEFVHSVLSGAEGTEGVDEGAVTLSVELPVVARADGPVVVIVEDLASGRWGGSYATVLSGVGDDLQTALLTTPRTITLLEPEDAMVVGSTLFETIPDPDVAWVEFFLDGEPAGDRRSSPYALRLDMGRIPEPHRIEVVAYDAAGREIGRDRLTVNESGGVFRVRIVRPDQQLRQGAALTGPVVVEAQVEAPRAVPVSKVEFFWNEDLVATRYAAPFAQRIPVPADRPEGFFRVVAHLEDGATAEDVLFVNSPGGTERVRVDLVQLYTVVTDRDGRPVRGLGSDSFRILEGGVEQEIATFSEAMDQPLTVGLAVDTSASMFVKLPRVQKAAGRFISGLDGSKDRAFLVDFGSDPRLYHDTSKDLEAVESALYRLEPAGQTAIWKGISFSLVQLQGIQGKKALIVFSDGADEDPDFAFRTCLKFARRVGVPIYVIVSNDEIYRTGGRGLNVRGFISRLESLTRAVGGRVFFSRVGEDLENIYDQIDEELRSQYVLGYYARGEDDGRWRSVRIDIDEPGARARTVAGYFR